MNSYPASISLAEFNAHCSALTDIVRTEAVRALNRHGFWGIIPDPLPAPTFEALRQKYHRLRYTGGRWFPVLSTNCHDVIYDTPHVNMLYRGWHDVTHIELDRGFDFESELAVARFKSLSIPEGPMRDIMLADAVGESEFAEATGGKFPLYQRLWAFDYVRWGRDEAIQMHRFDTA